MGEYERQRLHGWEKFIYNMYMILTFPVRKWWVILSVLATVLLVLIIRVWNLIIRLISIFKAIVAILAKNYIIIVFRTALWTKFRHLYIPLELYNLNRNNKRNKSDNKTDYSHNKTCF